MYECIFIGINQCRETGIVATGVSPFVISLIETAKVIEEITKQQDYIEDKFDIVTDMLGNT